MAITDVETILGQIADDDETDFAAAIAAGFSSLTAAQQTFTTENVLDAASVAARRVASIKAHRPTVTRLRAAFAAASVNPGTFQTASGHESLTGTGTLS